MLRRLVWWFGPLVDPRTWLAHAHLLVGALSAPIALGLVVAAVGGAFCFVPALVGLPLVVAAFGFTAWVASLVRRRAAWVTGSVLASRPLAPRRGAWWRGFRTVVGDADRWRQFGFFWADLAVAPVFLALALVPLVAVVQMVIGLDLTDRAVPRGVLGVVVGVPAAGLIPRITVPLARTKVAFDAWFLGPDRLAVVEQRAAALTEQRQDILDAVAVERRRIERNLHDGVQQQLVATGIDLGMALDHIDDDPDRSRALLGQAREKLQGSIGELRSLGRGLHPAILDDRGIDAALSAVVAASPIPVSVHVEAGVDLPTDHAETLYFVTNEAIANVLKHAQARVASVHLVRLGDRIRLTVHDDGRGGADIGGGTGLAGMRARVLAMDGSFTVSSPAGGPTTIVAELPGASR